MTRKLTIFISAVSGGLLFNYLRIPAGAMLGSLLGTAASQMLMDIKLEIPAFWKRSARMVMGSYIGLGITLEGIRQLKSIVGAVLLVIVGMVLLAAIATYVQHKFLNRNLAEAFLSCLPAGLTEIAMNAEELGADPLQLTTIHLIRLLSTVILITILVSFFK